MRRASVSAAEAEETSGAVGGGVAERPWAVGAWGVGTSGVCQAHMRHIRSSGLIIDLLVLSRGLHRYRLLVLADSAARGRATVVPPAL